jgi:hypothetical protein
MPGTSYAELEHEDGYGAGNHIGYWCMGDRERADEAGTRDTQRDIHVREGFPTLIVFV